MTFNDWIETQFNSGRIDREEFNRDLDKLREEVEDKNKRAYRRFMREVKISKRIASGINLSGYHSGEIADTPKPCSSVCCGNKRATEGPTIQELRHDSN